jgi:hypothetical protein
MLLVTNGLLIGAFAAAATVSTARDSHLFHTWLRASEIARRRTERSELRSSCPRATTRAPDSKRDARAAVNGHYLIATSRRIGIATSTASCRFRRSSRYSIALSTRDQRVFGR